jgi:hypothetical protein
VKYSLRLSYNIFKPEFYLNLEAFYDEGVADFISIIFYNSDNALNTLGTKPHLVEPVLGCFSTATVRVTSD